MPRQRGIRARMDRLEGHAHETMDDGQDAIRELTAIVRDLLAKIDALAHGTVEEFMDGFDGQLVTKRGALMNLLTGGDKADTVVFPVSLRINLREDDK